MAIPLKSLSKAKRLTHDAITEQIRHRIRVGLIHPGSALPTRRMLADEFGAAIGTVQKAVDELVADGTVVVRGRRGTFVAGERPRQNRENWSSWHDSYESEVRRMSIGVVARVPLDEQYVEQGLIWARMVIQSIERGSDRLAAYSSLINRELPGGSIMPIDESIERGLSSGHDAIIVVFPNTEDVLETSTLTNAGMRTPIVVVGSESKTTHPFMSVNVDQEDAGRQAAVHAIDSGAKSLLYFSTFGFDWALSRAAGVTAAAKQCGLPSDAVRLSYDSAVPNWIHLSKDVIHETEGYSRACLVLDQMPMSDAVIAASDYMAYGYMRAAAERGLKAGRDYMIIGFDDAPRSLNAGLSSLSPPLLELGREAVRTAMMAVKHEHPVLRSYLNSQLTVRESSFFSKGGNLK